MPQKPPPLTPEDHALWEALSASVTPLTKTSPLLEKPEVKVSVSRHFTPPRAPLGKADYGTLPFLEEGITAGLDRKTAQRIKQGNYPIDATLDLHGHTRDQAYTAITQFIHHAAEQGLRCLLIITGKGKEATSPGLLRASLPGWLNAPVNREKILFFSDASPKHGGSGAVYVFLKKGRG